MNIEPDDNEEAVEEPVIHNPAALLKAHEELKADFKSLKSSYEALQTQTNTETVDSPWKAIALRNQVTLALAEKGIKNPAVAKYINTNDLDLDEDGNIAGLDERIALAATEFPELFDVKRQVGGKVEAAPRPAVVTERSATEMQADMILGKR